MNEEQKTLVAKEILETIMGRQFFEWYESGKFSDYISGTYPKDDPRQPTKEQILSDIKRIFGL